MKTTMKLAMVITALVLIISPLIYVSVANQLENGSHGVGLLKSADSFAYIGDNVTYSIQVYNPSDYDLYNVNVTDAMLEFEDTIPFIAANNMTGVTYTLQRTALNTDPNPLVNTVSVEAVDSEGIRSTATTQASTTIAERWLNITKTGPEYAHKGDSIKYSITIENVADTTVSNVTVMDETLGFSWNGDLSPSEKNVFNLTYVIPLNASDPLVNTATAYAEINQTTLFAESECSVDILQPKLAVNKTVEPQETFAGNNVTFTIQVKNIGDTALYNLTLIDSMYGAVPTELIPLSLSPQESFTWSFNATVTACNFNKATATALDILGKQVTACDKVFFNVKPRTCPKSMGYWKNHPEEWPVEKINICNASYSKNEAIQIIKEANSKDATNMLMVQLIIVKLNRRCGVSPEFKCQQQTLNVDQVINNAENFLCTHPFGSNPRGTARQEALDAKNILDAFNNNGD